MAFDFKIEYMKENSIPPVDTSSRLNINNKQIERSHKAEKNIALDWNWCNTPKSSSIWNLTESVISSISYRIKKNKWNDSSAAETQHKNET